MELKGKKINFLGDSITQGIGASDEAHIYLSVLKSREGLAEARNYGISGTRLARQTTYKTEGLVAYVDRYMEMDDDADVVVIFGGTNDYGHGDAKMGEPTDTCPDTVYGALNIMLDGLITKYPKGTIVFMTPLQRVESPNPSRINLTRYGYDLIDYVNVIKDRCEYYSIPVLDLYSVSGIHPANDVNRETFCPDGLHPSDAGNEKIANLLAAFLKQL